MLSANFSIPFMYAGTTHLKPTSKPLCVSKKRANATSLENASSTFIQNALISASSLLAMFHGGALRTDVPIRPK